MAYTGPFDKSGNPTVPQYTAPTNPMRLGPNVLSQISNLEKNKPKVGTPYQSTSPILQGLTTGSPMAGIPTSQNFPGYIYGNPNRGVPQVPTTLPGAVPGNYSPSAGGIPAVPNPQQTQAAALAGNLANLGNIGNLATQTGTLNAKLGALPYQANLPNYTGLLGQASANAGSLLSGQLPADVVQQLTQAAAERGVAMGSPGSPNSNAALLRAIGLTSLGLQQTGLQNFGNLVGLTPTGPKFDPSSMFVDPNTAFQAQLLANIYNAAPIPQYAQNAAMNALNRGLNQGQQQTQQQPSAQSPTLDLVGGIIGKYSPTVNPTGAQPGTIGSISSGAPPDQYAGFDPSDPSQGFYEDPFYGVALDENAPSSDEINVDDLYPTG